MRAQFIGISITLAQRDIETHLPQLIELVPKTLQQSLQEAMNNASDAKNRLRKSVYRAALGYFKHREWVFSCHFKRGIRISVMARQLLSTQETRKLEEQLLSANLPRAFVCEPILSKVNPDNTKAAVEANLRSNRHWSYGLD